MGDQSEEAFAPTLDSGGTSGDAAGGLSAGATFADRWVLERLLGRGGMGSAWLARDTLLLRPCVIKVLHEAPYHEDDRVERFLREARLTAQLRHEHVVATYDLGIGADGVPFLVLEQLEGEPLDAVLRAQGAMSVTRCVAIGVQILRGLVAAHAAGVVHHDLKPANVFLTRNGVVKLLDFGVAAFAGRTEGDDLASLRERERTTAGTPNYMAPEQWAGTRADVRSDLWAVGVVLFELLTARLPFSGPTPVAIATSILSDEPTYPVALHIPGHAELVAQIQHALQKDVADRPPDAATMLASLETLWASVSAGAATSIRSASTAARPKLDADVGFTVHAPAALPRDAWTKLLAFAHRALDADEAESLPYDDPVAVVARRAREVLGEKADEYEAHAATSPTWVPREHELTFSLRAEGVRFDPPSRTFAWTEPVHRELFLARPESLQEGATTKARLEVFLGALLLAEVRFDLRAGVATAATAASSVERARCFERVYVAYADGDTAVARQLGAITAAMTPTRWIEADAGERAARAIGEFSRDAIDGADAVQVLWSSHALGSDLVDSAIRYGLERRGVERIRPVCWEQPTPIDAGRDRPPAALREAGLASIAAPMTALLAAVAASSLAASASASASTSAPAAPSASAAPSPPAPSAMAPGTRASLAGPPTPSPPPDTMVSGAAPVRHESGPLLGADLPASRARSGTSWLGCAILLALVAAVAFMVVWLRN